VIVVSTPGTALSRELGEPPAGTRMIRWDVEGPAPEPRIDIVVMPYMRISENLPWLETVQSRLVQSQSIGYDDVVLPPGHVFANASSVHETSTAELALALVLAAQRGIPDFVRAAERGEWKPERRPSLADRTVLILGYGGVGRAIEARLAPFEVNVVRVARTARDGVHGFRELPDLLPGADIVIAGVPLTAETTRIIDARFLAAMPDDALLVNVGRGATVDTDALLAETSSGRLRAALDVTDPEPLPQGHPLFALPNVLIAPHVGGATTAMLPRMARLLRRQIERMLRDEQPLNVVLRS
jgi:phosphoglycerate dehydrogenase-like enzyme